MTTSVRLGSLLHSRPDLHRGRPCLAGTGMTVHAVAVRHMQGMTAEKILEQFPDLDLARIYAALAFFYANRARIEAEIEADDRFGEELAAKYPHGWGRKPTPVDLPVSG